MWSRLTAATLAGAAGLLPLAARAQGYDRSAWDHGWDWSLGHMAFGGLMMLLFWGGVIVLIVVALRWLGGGPGGAAARQPTRGSARRILEERFARGEIDKDEFEARKHVLSD